MYTVSIMSSAVEIRVIQKSEIHALAGVYADCFNAAEIGEHWSIAAAEDFLKYLYSLQPDLFFVVLVDGDIVGGIAGVIKPWCDGKHIHEIELFVAPSRQRQGIAKLLTEQLILTAVERYKIVEFEGIADGGLHEFPLSWYVRIGVKPTGLIHIAGKPKEMLRFLSSAT